MARGSESAAERAAAKSEVGSTKDVMETLMETLVDPLLPSSVSSKDSLSEDAQDSQNSVARQMHAVVLLYNYYHRKQNPELELLDFSSFCNLAVKLRPVLFPFMKIINESGSMEMNGAEDHLSVTEKAIKDACDIAVALDASKDVPTTEGFPISKVAVLLIDSKKENCFLQFGAVTGGVWSLIEKEISAEEKVVRKRKRNTRTGDSEFLKLGYAAVKEVEGIESSELVVLETHDAYSLSKEKSAARFFILQCAQSFNISQSVPLNLLVESLEGPLVKKTSMGWTTTPVVEYYHMLPYVGFISSWLSGKDSCLPSLSAFSAQSKKPALSVSKCNGKDLDHIDSNYSVMKVDPLETISIESSEDSQTKHEQSPVREDTSGTHLENLNDNCDKGSIFRTKDDNVVKKFNKRCEISGSATNLEKESDECAKGSRSSMNDFNKNANSITKALHHKRKNISSDAHSPEDGVNSKVETTDPLKSNDTLSRDKKVPEKNGDMNISCNQNEIAKDDNVTEKFRKRSDLLDSAKNEVLSQRTAPYKNLLKKLYKRRAMTVSASKKKRRIYTENLDKNSNECSKGLFPDPNMNVPSGDAHCSGDGANPKVVVDPLKSTRAVATPFNENGISATKANTKCNTQAQDLTDSEDLQNASALLFRKRQELWNQICTMEEKLALYEDNLERIRDGEVSLARKCIKSVVSGNTSGEEHCNSQPEKQTGLCGIFLPGKSSCQDLEYICVKNNWRLPRYFIEPSDGEFESNVVVESKNLKLSSKGGLESNPGEARESSAAQMIAKIQKECA